MVDSPATEPAEANSFLFEATKWTLLLRAGDGDLDVKLQALEELCKRYWKPLWHYVRWAFPLSDTDAEDIVQGFLASAVKKDTLAKAREERGRFRSFLLASIRNYVLQDLRKGRAEKRGSGITAYPATLPQELEALPQAVSQEVEAKVDAEWAMTTMKAALVLVVNEYTKRGYATRVQSLVQFTLDSDAEGASREAAAEQCQISTAQFGVELHRFRSRLRVAFESMVRETVTCHEDAEEESRYLLSLLTWI